MWLQYLLWALVDIAVFALYLGGFAFSRKSLEDPKFLGQPLTPLASFLFSLVWPVLLPSYYVGTGIGIILVFWVCCIWHLFKGGLPALTKFGAWVYKNKGFEDKKPKKKKRQRKKRESAKKMESG